MKIISIKSYLHKVFFILEKQKKRIPFIILLFILSSVLDLIGISLFAPYVTVLLSPELFTEHKIYHYLLSNNYVNNVNDVLLGISLLVVLIFFFKAVSLIFINRIILNFSFFEGDRLIKKLLNAFQNISYLKYLEKNTASYIYSISNLAQHYAGTLILLLKVTGDVLIISIILIFLAIQNLQILMLLIAIITFCAVFYDLAFRRKLAEIGKNNNIYSKNIIQNVTEALTALKEIRVIGKENFFYDKVKNNSEKYAVNLVNQSIISQLPRFCIELVIIIFFVSIIILLVYLLQQSLVEIAPSLVMFGIAAVRIAPSVNQILTSISLMRAGADGINILYNDIYDINILQSNREFDLSNKNEVEFESLHIEDISFSYPNTIDKSISNISLNIKKGEMIGFIGKSGSGKTTLMNILLGFLTPDSGKLMINKHSSKMSMEMFTSKSAYIPQEIFIMDRSIRENITLIDDIKEIDELSLEQSIKQSSLEHLINDLPEGLLTRLGDSGMRLSGGQRQRIALARAFYHKREILFLDEATSALDLETENEIIKEIKKYKGKKTIFIIAHKLSTVENCDRIYRLENGRIAEYGRLNEIKSKKN